MRAAVIAELSRLGRRRVLVPTLAVVAVYAAVVSWILIALADPSGPGIVTIDALSQAGGGTRTVSFAAVFSSVLVLALFTGMSAGDHARGTWRAALLQHPSRWSLAAGTFAARVVMLTVAAVVLFAVGWAVSFAVAPVYDVDTATWFTAESWRAAGEDLLRVFAFGTGWALLGSVLGTLTRSVPIGLAIGVLWAGPIENAIGEDMAFADRWFPGQLLGQVVTEISENSALQIGATLGVYALVALAVAGWVVQRRDVTS